MKDKSQLPPDVFDVTQNKATEAPYSGKYYTFDEKGMYHCVVCGVNLFTSDNKYDAGCGWPSFFDKASGANVKIVKDTTHGMVRDEIVCGECGSHLGHIFDDGPNPTGKRYCVNSLSLDFEGEKKKSE